MPQVGLRDLHYAVLTSDDSTGVEYDTPKPIVGAINATITPTTNSATLYADDGAAETATALGEITVALNTKDLPSEVQADLLGHEVNSEGVLIRKSTDVAPYVAIGFKSEKSNGKFRYVWLYKGKFQPSEQAYNTKTDTPEFQTPTINGTFVRREFDDAWQATGDEDDDTFTGGDTWFDEVYEAGNGGGGGVEG